MFEFLSKRWCLWRRRCHTCAFLRVRVGLTSAYLVLDETLVRRYGSCVCSSLPWSNGNEMTDVKTTPTCTSWSFSSFPCDHKPFSLLWCCAQQPPMAHLSHLIFIYKCQPVTCWWSQTVKYWTMLDGSSNPGRFIVWVSSMIFFNQYQRGSRSLDMWREWVHKRSLDFFPVWPNAVIHDYTCVTFA